MTASDSVGHSQTPVARRDEHTLTALEALKIFEQQGSPRSQRATERYWKAGKLDVYSPQGVVCDDERYDG